VQNFLDKASSTMAISQLQTWEARINT